MTKTIAAPRIAVWLCILGALSVAGCKPHYSWRSDWSSGGHRTISQIHNGVTRKLDTRFDMEIQDGRITKFGTGAVVELSETGGAQPREAELRENAGTLDLWIKDHGSFRRASAEEETWRETFLREITSK